MENTNKLHQAKVARTFDATDDNSGDLLFEVHEVMQFNYSDEYLVMLKEITPQARLIALKGLPESSGSDTLVAASFFASLYNKIELKHGLAMDVLPLLVDEAIITEAKQTESLSWLAQVAILSVDVSIANEISLASRDAVMDKMFEALLMHELEMQNGQFTPSEELKILFQIKEQSEVIAKYDVLPSEFSLAANDEVIVDE